MMIALALMAADPFPAPVTPTATLQISCRQGECHWQQIRRIERVRRGASGEVLRRLVSRAGRSAHPGDRMPPDRYSPGLRIEWAAAPRIEYALCSTRRPATIFRSASNGDYVVTHLGLRNMAGYEYAAGTLYLRACHNLSLANWSENRTLQRGYPETRGRQDRFRTLDAALAALR